MDPLYKDIGSDDIPSVGFNGGLVKVISGEYRSVIGPGRPQTEVMYLDLHMDKDSSIEVSISADILSLLSSIVILLSLY